MRTDVFAALTQADRWRTRLAAAQITPLETPVRLVVDEAPLQRNGVRRAALATFVRPA